MTTLGKIIGGGFPLAAYGGRRDIMAMIAPSGPVYQAGTLSGHPAVMAAGEATLAELTPDLYRGIEARADRLEEGLRRPGLSVSRVGSLLTAFFRDRAPANFAEARESDTEQFARLFNSLRARGVLLPPSQYEAWFLSAAHDDEVIDATLEALER